MSVVAVVDYGSGNLFSVVKALVKTAPKGTSISLTSDATDIARADRVVFPGQGSPTSCMASLRERGLIDAVRSAIRNKIFLGICMGMQLMFARSEEGEIDCLGMIDEPVTRLRSESSDTLRLPHIGWNRVYIQGDHPLWNGVPDSSWFYFVHSYAWTNISHPLSIGVSFHGQAFSAAVGWDNVACLQFHPEKSAEAGLQILRNFQLWSPILPAAQHV